MLLCDFFVCLFFFVNEHGCNLRYGRFWGELLRIKGLGSDHCYIGYVDPEMSQSCDSCAAQTRFGP